MFLRTGLERRWATRLIIDLVFIARFYVIFSYISAQEFAILLLAVWPNFFGLENIQREFKREKLFFKTYLV